MAMTTKNHRFDDSKYAQFERRCRETNREPSELLRELADAYTENRITITPTDATKKAMEMYS